MANNPNSSPEAQAEALLAAERNLLETSSPLALLEAIDDVIEVLKALIHRKDTAPGPDARANAKKLIDKLFDLLAKIRSTLRALLEGGLANQHQAEEGSSGEMQVGGITIRKASSDEEAMADLRPKAKAPKR